MKKRSIGKSEGMRTEKKEKRNKKRLKGSKKKREYKKKG